MTEQHDNIRHVFAYGTLRPYSRGGRFAPATHIMSGVQMRLIEGNFYFPALEVVEGSSVVYGNLIEITTPKLRSLDRYEGVDRGFYQRIVRPAQSMEDGSVTECFVYIAASAHDPTAPLIPSGDWAALFPD